MGADGEIDHVRLIVVYLRSDIVGWMVHGAGEGRRSPGGEEVATKYVRLIGKARARGGASAASMPG